MTDQTRAGAEHPAARLVLRPLHEADDEALVALFADPHTALWNPGPADGDVPRWRAESMVWAADFRTWAVAEMPGAEMFDARVPRVGGPGAGVPAAGVPGAGVPGASSAASGDAAAGTLVGLVSLFGINPADRTAEIGFRTVPAHRGRGIATRALELACRSAAAEGIVQRIHLYHAVANVGSCRVATANHFLLESVLPANYRYGDGHLHDEHLHVRDLISPG